MRTSSSINWIELHGQAHIVRYSLDRTLCGQTLDDATVIVKGMDLDGCLDCIGVYAGQNKDERPIVPDAESWETP